MSKRNVAFVKPEDPSFLRKIKEQIGYKEGPTVETKRQKLENYSDSDEEGCGEAEDEKPQVVVLKAGDLTAEEADAEKKRIEKEEQEKPADLSKRIIFKAKTKSSVDEASASGSSKEEKRKSKKPTKGLKSKLSFNDEDEEC